MTTPNGLTAHTATPPPIAIDQSVKRRHHQENGEGHTIARGDKVMDINSHVIHDTSHMTRRQDIISFGEESDEEGSTAEEGEWDTVPSETTTTDFHPEAVEPLDYIETNPRIDSRGPVISGGYDVPPPPSHRYENWSILVNVGKPEGYEESGKRGKPIKRSKASRVGKVDRLRTPLPLPRSAKHFRASPSSRKRRFSGRTIRPIQLPNTVASEEGDMAQADEMGDGEGKDDGFVDGGEAVKRRSKKRTGGIHMLLPTMGNNSPPSSPSNTPISRRRASSRKSRTKPRVRKQSKPQLAPADISTQESTTQGPGSSDTSDNLPHDEATQLHTGEDPIDLGSEDEYDDARSLTPNPHELVSITTSTSESNKVRKKAENIRSVQSMKYLHRDQVSDISTPQCSTLLHISRKQSVENMVPDSNETSDTDFTSLYPSNETNWTNKRFESDLSTAPFSSETSDMDTSGNERVATTTNGGSTTALTNTKVEVNSSGSPHSTSPVTPGENKATNNSGSSGEEATKEKREVPTKLPAKHPPPPVSKKPTLKTPPGVGNKTSSPVPAKRALQHTKSSPYVCRVSNSSSVNSQPVTHVPTRSKSTKGNIPLKPKPPIAAKPNIKPELKPKLLVATGGGPAGLRRSIKSSSSVVQSVPVVAHRALSIDAGSQRVKTGSRSSMRKIHSDSELGLSHTVLEKSPSPVLKRLAKLHEEKEEDDETTQSPRTPPVPVKPVKPVKSRRDVVEKSIHPRKNTTSLEVSDSDRHKDLDGSKQVSSASLSDSSKPPSSSEATSGHSQSPSMSPYPSPAIKKKPLLPVKPPKKTSITSVPQQSLLDSGTASPPVSHRTNSDINKLTGHSSPSIDGNSPLLPKRHHQVITPTSQPMAQHSVTPSERVNSPSPPPLPPRNSDSSSEMKRKSLLIESCLPKNPDLVRALKSSPPRRPPPCPPTTKHTTTAAASSNEPTDVGLKNQNSESEIRGRTYSSHLSTKQITAISTNYEVCEPDDSEKHLQKYRHNSEVASSVAVYSQVRKPSSSGFKTMQDVETVRSKTPDNLISDSRSSMDSGEQEDSKKGSDSELEMAFGRENSRKRFSSSSSTASQRRAPPMPPKYLTSDETNVPAIVSPQSADKTTPILKRHAHKVLSPQSSLSPPRCESPPPLPDQPIPRKKDRFSVRDSASKGAITKSASTSLLNENIATPPQTTDTPPKKPSRVARRDPIYECITDFPDSRFKRAKRDYEEIILLSDDDEPDVINEKINIGSSSSENKEPSPSRTSLGGVASPKSPYGEISSPIGVRSPRTSTGTVAVEPKLPLEDLRENWKRSPQAMRKRQAKSFSGKKSQTTMLRRFGSARYKNKVSTIPASMVKSLSLQRSVSLDKLDDRMDRSTRNSIHHPVSSSEDEEEESSVVSPTTQGLPKTPSGELLYSTPRDVQKKAGKLSQSASAFVDIEPLYQYINTAEFLREPGDLPPPSLSSSTPSNSSPKQPSSMSFLSSRNSKQNQLEIARQLSFRKLWCELPDIIKSGILKTLSVEERKLQEAMYEVITSEATYLRSLDVLIEHFMEDPGMNPNLPEGRRVLDKRQHHVIFSNVREVREVSARFLEDLENRQKEGTVIRNITDIVLEYAEGKLDSYIRYCTNQVYQIRELQDALEKNVMFREYLRRLESDKCCQNLNVQSFLLLPMQRITRLPLLMLAILNRTPLDHPDHEMVEMTLRTVQKLVTACNDGARKMERTEQLHEIHSRLDFGKLKPFPLVSVSRQLERKGTLVQLQVEQKLLGKTRIKKRQLYVFSFTDYVIITKRKKDAKGDYNYRVIDHASRALVEVEWIESHPAVTVPKQVFGEHGSVAQAMWAVSAAGARHAFMVTILDNVHHRSEEYIFLAQNDTDKTRWMESLIRADVERDEEKIYELWDCPQVQAVFDYEAQQPDELDLQRGDVVKVYRKMADGWYEGERLRDLQCGWFPSNFIVEIENQHTKARNLRETYRLFSLPLNQDQNTR